MPVDPGKTGYRFYALGLLLLMGIFNAADRNILSVLADAIKADLHISDSTLAFLYGTAFITLYTLLGLPAARLADRMRRPRLLAGGLTLWSAFTALSGIAPNFAVLALSRVGVGIGEATANPVSHSLMCDYFPARQRARVIAIYLASIHIGGGLVAAIGGYLLDVWPDSCSLFGLCTVRPWQIAFLVVGLPGVLLAVLISQLREPIRGEIDGHPQVPPATGHWKVAFQDLLSVLPVVATVTLYRQYGAAVALRNIRLLTMLLAGAVLLAWATGDVLQWMALFIGTGAVISWFQHVAQNDRGFVRLTIGTPAFIYSLAGYAFMGGLMGAAHFWMIPYAMRTFNISAGYAGLTMGPTMAIGGLVGSVIGGFASDAWRSRDVRGHLLWSMAVLATMTITYVAMLMTSSLASYMVAAFLFSCAAVAWSGSAGANVQELVLPRMRATTSAVYALSITLVVMAVGPYSAAKIGEISGSLHTGLLSLTILLPAAGLLLWLASQRMTAAVETKVSRAEEADLTV
jgi:MFS family permease